MLCNKRESVDKGKCVYTIYTYLQHSICGHLVHSMGNMHKHIYINSLSPHASVDIAKDILLLLFHRSSKVPPAEVFQIGNHFLKPDCLHQISDPASPPVKNHSSFTEKFTHIGNVSRAHKKPNSGTTKSSFQEFCPLTQMEAWMPALQLTNTCDLALAPS